jgi:hypothetical protein
MTGNPTRRVKVILHPSPHPTDPIYQTGWNFISGKNLSPTSAGPSTMLVH